MYDHFHGWPGPSQDPVFESFSALTGVAAFTRRIRLGHLVLCAGYRNAALVAKMVSTLDVISNGRVDVGNLGGQTPYERLRQKTGSPV